MARVTVEGCLKYIPNRFDLVLAATKRTRQLLSGDDSLVSKHHDKDTVIALREIEEGKIDQSKIEATDHAEQVQSLVREGTAE